MSHGGNDGQHWRTGDELDYLRGLGMHLRGLDRLGRPRWSPEDRLVLLLGYKRTMALRVEWGDIDPAIVARDLEFMIDQEMRHRKVFVPKDGHGVDVGARRYAVPVGRNRAEIRKGGDGDDEAA